jgi:hypothetical protein
MHNIEWINATASTVDYSAQAVDEYKRGMGSRVDEYTLKFENDFNVSNGEDIGGLIVYSDSCVYDYENFVGWVR